MELADTLPCVQKPTTEPCAEPLNPVDNLMPYFFQIYSSEGRFIRNSSSSVTKCHLTIKMFMFLRAHILRWAKPQNTKCGRWQCGFLRREIHRASTTQNMKTQVITVSTSVLQLKRKVKLR